MTARLNQEVAGGLPHLSPVLWNPGVVETGTGTNAKRIRPTVTISPAEA
jgi:hypothetical protein